MKYEQKRIAHLILQDGSVYQGYAVGKIGTTTGEICFNTGMTGYQEIYTDPSYFGQIIVNTTSHIGNYGVHNAEIESDKIQFNGLVCKSFSPIASRLDGDDTLQNYFENNGVVGISDLDTRGIVKYIRDKGAMNAVISSEITDLAKLKEIVKNVPSMSGLELASKVTTDDAYFIGDKTSEFKVAVLDLGVKSNILRNIANLGCYLKVFPSNTPVSEILSWEADGYFISNGPGDPAATDYAIDSVKLLIAENKPVFGICLGHQIICLTYGIGTFKMHNGHRGLNHPVKNLITGLSEITSQNHGFAVKMDDVINHPDIELTHINLNDDTVEGIRVKDKPVFSVQHHPEAAPGPNDAQYLFGEFIGLLKSKK